MKKTSIITLVSFFTITSSLFGQQYESYKRLNDTTIYSNHLNYVKNISITVPDVWQKNINQSFPLIVIFDRQNNRNYSYIIRTIDYLTSTAQMPRSIVIGVKSDEMHRYRETSYIGNGKAIDNEKFIFDELIPLARKNYKASPFTLLIGHSRYGYFTTSLLFSKLKEINAIISMSPFFSEKGISLTDSVNTLNNIQFKYYKYYYFGIGNDYPNDFYKMDSSLEKLNNSKINAKGWLFKQAYHNATPGLTIARSLYKIFEYWNKEQNRYSSNSNNSVSTLSTIEKNIDAHYGSRLKISLGNLNGKGWYFFNLKEYRKAIEAWKKLMEFYPNFSEGYLYIATAKSKTKLKSDESFENFYKSLVKSKFYTDKEKSKLKKEAKDIKE